MFWRLFVRDTPLLDSALEGIVFKEGKGRFYGKFTKKKRLLAYDEVAKCLRYYTPQRALKGTIYLHDILFITPGRSVGRDTRKDSVFEITIPGRVYVFHVNNIRETRKWIGIVSREIDSLKIRDRVQLNNGNISEGTYSKTLRPNSTVLNPLKIGDHREHEECCFLFDEEHQHKIIALESLCTLQAMKIYELALSVEKSQKKCAELEAPPSEEIKKLKDQYFQLRVSFEREKLQVLDLKAKIEEEDEKKLKEQDKQMVRKVEKHHPLDFVQAVKVMQIERGDSPKPTSSQKKNITASPSFVNLPNDKSKMEEIKRLQEELEHTKALLAHEKTRALESPVNFNSPSVSPLLFENSRNGLNTSTSSTTSSASNRSPTMPPRTTTPSNLSNSSKLHAIPENVAINNPKLGSYRTFSPAILTNPYLEHRANSLSLQREPSPKQLGTQPPASPPLSTRTIASNPSTPATPSPLAFLLSPNTSSPLASLQNGSENSQIISPQPRYASQQTSILDSTIASALASSPSPQSSDFSESYDSLASDSQTTPLLSSPEVITKPQNGTHGNAVNGLRTSNNGLRKGLRNSDDATSKVLGDFNIVSVVSTVKSLNSSAGISMDFNLVSPEIITKPRSYSESGTSPPFKNVNYNLPNGKQLNSVKATEIGRSRTNSNPPTFNSPSSTTKLSSVTSSTVRSPPTTTTSVGSPALNSNLGPELTEFLSSHPDDNGWAVQVMARLNEAIAEIASLASQLRVEREKVKGLMEEREHMLDKMEEMTAESAKNEKFKYKMEDLLETSEGKLNALRKAFDMENQLRIAAEAKLSQLAQAQAALQQSIMDDEMPPHPEILTPLLTNFSH